MDPLLTMTGDTITWTVKQSEGTPGSTKDCPQLACTDVSLLFHNAAFGAMVLRAVLNADKTCTIKGTVTSMATKWGTNAGVNHYRVRHNNKNASPDPVIIVDCPGCGPGPDCVKK
jgi:hypothetical protein